MNETVNVIAAVLIVIVIGAAVAYIIKEKKRGKKCIGCPYSSCCEKKSCTSYKSNPKDDN